MVNSSVVNSELAEQFVAQICERWFLHSEKSFHSPSLGIND